MNECVRFGFCRMLCDGTGDATTIADSEFRYCIYYEPRVDLSELLEIVDEIERCEYLSARVCHDTHKEWADRIREALGLSDGVDGG